MRVECPTCGNTDGFTEYERDDINHIIIYTCDKCDHFVVVSYTEYAMPGGSSELQETATSE